MDRATFESQKAFAGEKKPSMQRRCVDHDYTARRMYMITMVTEGRKTLFGKVVGRSEAVEPSAEAPHIELSPLGEAVAQIWQTIGSHHPEVKVVALPLIYLQENGFTDLAKPGGKRMEACVRGQLLILAPWEHHNEKITIKRGQCLQLNEMAKMICEE